MGRVFKKRIPVTDPVSGELSERESQKYYVEYRDEHGKKRRKAVSPDKSVATRKLAQIERDVDRRRNGEIDPYEEHRRRPITDHLRDFEQFLRSKGGSEKHVSQVVKRATDVMTDCGFVLLADLRPGAVQNNLHERRQSGRSAQTCNFYLKAATQFVRWLVQDRRLLDNPLRGLTLLNVRIDRRHDRRALSAEEYERLLNAAATGKRVDGMSGAERRILYLVGSSTGLRRAELSSLTLRSLNLDGEFPSVAVLAAYSKNGRDDTLPLHPAVVAEIRVWLATQKCTPSQPLFHLRSAGGELRDTAKMMRRDLAAARSKWIAETDDPEERKRRESSDFLQYQNSAGLFADFHANRHTFISNLAQAGVHPKMAQTLARHSTINLTMNTYTHVNMEEKSRAVGRLQGPRANAPDQAIVDQKRPKVEAAEVSVLGPSGVPNGAPEQSAPGPEEAPSDMIAELRSVVTTHASVVHNTNEGDGLDAYWPVLAASDTQAERTCFEMHPEGFEPPTLGSEDRCSIQLSYGC